jgi:NADH:ubiquinone oxidoreductase subunit
VKTFWLQFFTWWNGATLGARFFTWRKGTFVGSDEFGNRYYRAVVPPLGERRWVLYAGLAEPSQIPSGWHGWMHHTVAAPPVQDGYVARDWQKPHRPNLTGTSGAYRPRGSMLASGRRPKATGDYDAWTPGG